MTVTEDRAATGAPEKEVGKPRRRKEDARLITGRTLWTDNLVLPGLLHMSVVRSPVAHARITGIDVSAAQQAPGVLAVLTGRDLADEQGSLPCAWPVTPDMVNPGAPAVAVDQVNHVGEAVAVVVARSRAAAADALELVDVDYEPLPPVLDMEAALAEGADLVHPGTASNRSYHWVFDGGEAGTAADTEQAFADAEVVVSRRFVQQRLIPAFMEPRSVVVQPQGDNYTVWSATQVPHILRLMLSMVTGIPEHKVKVIAPDVGGGFGGKLQVTPEEVLTLLAARRVGRPVKWTETRSESLMSAHHGRDQIQYIDIAADREGNVKGLRCRILADMGAYLRLITPGVPVLGAFMFIGIYKFPAYRFECDGVFTTKTPTDAYRGAGRPEATFAIERIMDELAVELGMDPLEVRRKNWIRAEEFPFTTAAGLEYDSGDYEAATQKALELIGYDELRAEQRRRRESGDPVQLGIGFSTFTEMCGIAPSRVLGSLSYGAGGWEQASIRMLPTGKVEVVTGTSPHGQGHETAWSQIVADQLGVPFEDVEVLHGDTAVSARGLDTYGSRSLVVGGVAVVKAAEKVVAKARRVAAHLLEASEDDLDFAGGSFSVRGTPGTSVSIQEVSLACFTSHNFPEGMEPSIDAEATFDPENFSFPHGTHICAAEVDTETGRVTIRKYACVDDIGEIVNPLIVEGQVHGGLAQGIAQALYEEAVYDADGNLTTGTFVDYLVPSAADLPHFDTGNTVSPALANPLGAKGVGEAGTIASTPAVVNAALDAVRHLGVTDIRMPLTPERVWRALQGGGDGGDRATAGTTAYGGAQTETTAGVSTPQSSLGGDR
ncbi:xanthine dehydrogenase family protein molybdopterin-binding subunit [Geodermatophilus sp. YIM 151500]|uniref:xanthine dehydrogenase family protein molybdopterin-binding subunit n=1 Tax=Geodermatophilus sp. YIM 151500 TaxID=2984531 RepID=UPI0021E4A31C|nr:xanthine dehydrogenase family protein molybdopterin-binding subunit [Geodermatophilus sp. YIM 151500]MCV2490115.1 xanthine dehydrogenase family protein molybdopterin-binding subunit [Geodermatophilus sp. YIM 151500]